MGVVMKNPNLPNKNKQVEERCFKPHGSAVYDVTVGIDPRISGWDWVCNNKQLRSLWQQAMKNKRFYWN